MKQQHFLLVQILISVLHYLQCASSSSAAAASSSCFVVNVDHSPSSSPFLSPSSSSSSLPFLSWQGNGRVIVVPSFITTTTTTTPKTATRKRQTSMMFTLHSSSTSLDDDSSSTHGKESDDDDDDDDDSSPSLDLKSYQQELARRRKQNSDRGTGAQHDNDENSTTTTPDTEVVEENQVALLFDGYDLRDIIYNKWGECFDVDFQRVDSYGFRNVYLNIMPFRLGGRTFRHPTEYDYLCHLQAVVEILVKYNQLDFILTQIQETTKKPRAGTSPLVAVPLRLDLTPEQVDKILG